ncbi:hypothetical protein BV20DRAFT_1125230 [Pilatotrama ljubarskyi]|nr:hypothetical protein BV20DRAFT_1125230 [Pilatotrama ljubarskyi]
MWVELRRCVSRYVWAMPPGLKTIDLVETSQDTAFFTADDRRAQITLMNPDVPGTKSVEMKKTRYTLTNYGRIGYRVEIWLPGEQKPERIGTIWARRPSPTDLAATRYAVVKGLKDMIDDPEAKLSAYEVDAMYQVLPEL